LQPGGGWPGFHSDYLSDLRVLLDSVLPPGYYARREASLQIGTVDPDLNLPTKTPERTVSDIAVYQTAGGVATAVAGGAAPALTLPLAEAILPQEDVSSVVIYRVEGGQLPGRPVTRIELLSPANKPPGAYARLYQIRRVETLLSGLCLVEIDLIHNRRPLDARIPSYVDQQEGAAPYHIAVHDPRPTWSQGTTAIFTVGVLEALPVLPVPLADGDQVAVDFGAAYQQTYSSSRLFHLWVDYNREPINMRTYSATDQAGIRARMAQIAQEIT
jgi:Protein of unknown function (DUF4058)